MCTVHTPHVTDGHVGQSARLFPVLMVLNLYVRHVSKAGGRSKFKVFYINSSFCPISSLARAHAQVNLMQPNRYVDKYTMEAMSFAINTPILISIARAVALL